MEKEIFKNILLSFMCDANKWSNDDVYDKYAILLKQMFANLEAKVENTARLKMLLEIERSLRKQEHKELEKARHDKSRYKKAIGKLKQKLAKKENEFNWLHQKFAKMLNKEGD